MTVGPGTRLGPYEIVARIGAGGMGEVFRARDTRLDRSVAVKILPAEFAASAQLRVRFEREARAISQLNHPNICTLFDVGENYLVMELLEGETLADRLARGALPIREVLRTGTQIADALDRAHRSGIIHRDLKPGNVMLTKSGAKLLDFGLAKSGAEAVNLDGATEQRPLTQEGTILGTFQYMSPEQLEGADVDARSDIFAFGAMLYEMATGHRAFDGKTKTSLVAAIVAAEPKPMAELQPMTPPALEMLIRACIAKEPDERIQTMHDVALQLRWISDTITSHSGMAATIDLPRRRKWTSVVWPAAMVVVAAGTWLAATWWQRTHTTQRVYRTTIQTSEGSPLGSGSGRMVLSPDGTMLVYCGIAKSGNSMLFIRRLDEMAWRAIEGTDSGYAPFWSPDGSAVAFFKRGNLQKVAANGSAAPETIAHVGDDVFDGTWRGNTIVYARFTAGLFRVHAAGGEPGQLVRPDKPCPMLTSPYLMPDEKHLVYYCSAPPPAESASFVTTLDGSEKPHLFLKANAGIDVVPGEILFSRGGILYAQPFDARSMTLSGEPRSIANIQIYNDARPAYFSATSHEIVYLPSGSEVRTELVHADRTGKRLGTIAPPGFYFSPRLSPDGKRVACDMSDTKGDGDIWIWDVSGTGGARFSFETENESAPVWSPDGSQIAYMYGLQAPHILKKQVNGGEAQPLVKELKWQFAGDWSGDGKTLLISGSAKESGAVNVFSYSLSEHRITPLVGTSNVWATAPRFSPDGHWFTYVTLNESGHSIMYVQPFPPNGSKWQVWSEEGFWPVFSRDGKSLFFVSGDGKLMQTAISTTGGFSAQTPQTLFPVRLRENVSGVAQYDVAPDGSFVLNSVPDNASSPMTLVVNWRGALAR